MSYSPILPTKACSFCGKEKQDVKVLVKTEDGKAAICDICVAEAKEILKEEGIIRVDKSN